MRFIFFYFFSLTFLVVNLASQYAFAESKEKKTIESARDFYKKGKFNQAIELYSKITPTSDFWFEALEERAWSYTQKNEFEKALADLHSLSSPVWSAQVGPETLMLSTFVSLKICAYKDVYNKINRFKTIMLPRSQNLEKIVNNSNSDLLAKEVENLLTQKWTLLKLGQNAALFPKYFYRDEALLRFYKQKQKNKLITRFKNLAKQDLDEILSNLNKMKIIDIELTQKVLGNDSLSSDGKNLEGHNSKPLKQNLTFSKEDLNQKVIFPITNDEVWIDEVGNYQVKAQLCDQNKKVSL